MRTVAIVGRGIIGNSWAMVFVRAGLEVSIWDRTGLGRSAVLEGLSALFEAVAGTDAAAPADALSRVRVHQDLAETLRGTMYVQESVPEEITLKRSIVREIIETADPDTIIASSTSGLLPSQLAEGFGGKDRFVVVHPLTPPHLLPVVEIVPSQATSEIVVERTCAFMRDVGQVPVRLYRETSGFVANRILAALLNEFFHLIRDGVIHPEDADIIITQGFGLRWACMGPLAAMDLNATGGIADYLSRYGSILESVARERNASCALDLAVVEKLTSAMRARHPLDQRAMRANARDRAIAQLRTVRTVVM